MQKCYKMGTVLHPLTVANNKNFRIGKFTGTILPCSQLCRYKIPLPNWWYKNMKLNIFGYGLKWFTLIPCCYWKWVLWVSGFLRIFQKLGSYPTSLCILDFPSLNKIKSTNFSTVPTPCTVNLDTQIMWSKLNSATDFLNDYPHYLLIALQIAMELTSFIGPLQGGSNLKLADL